THPVQSAKLGLVATALYGSSYVAGRFAPAEKAGRAVARISAAFNLRALTGADEEQSNLDAWAGLLAAAGYEGNIDLFRERGRVRGDFNRSRERQPYTDRRTG